MRPIRWIRPAVLVAGVALLALPAALSAQGQVDTIRQVSPFRPLDLPAPNVYRMGDGRPGPEYWQQAVDYQIRASVDPATNVLTGTETIRYTNHAPRALDYLWMHLEQNICAPESITNTLNQPPLVFGETAFDFSCHGFAGGDRLKGIAMDGRPLEHEVYGTTMRVELPEPLAPGKTAAIDVEWSFPIPEDGSGRMGRDGELYEIAQWYPRMAVYDDVRGWNHEPYIGAGEFYLDYGSFDVALTVPARFLVFATGTLQNPGDVLTADQRDRLARAMTADEPVAVVTASEAGSPATRPATDGTLTWRFHADSVRGFAFAMAPDVRWDASHYGKTRIDAVYRPDAADWEEAIRMAVHTIRFFSRQWYEYPYPHATTIEGPIAGMEYPMLTFVAGTSREDLQFTLLHEFGHEWFPMVVGSNERLYPWMDEGFNSFIDTYGQADYFKGTAFGDTVGQTPLHEVPEHGKPGIEQPMSLRPVEQNDLYWTAYHKPALAFRLLRDEVLGPDRFDPAFRAYIRAWAYKHPTPADFFRMMRDATGEDLDWYWREWIYGTARLDQAIAGVRRGEGGGSEVVIESRGDMVMPAELALTFADGTTATVDLPVEMWNLGDRFVYRVPGDRKVTAARLDPRQVMPDVDRSNDVWPR